MLIYVDIDGTICNKTDGKYKEAVPVMENIEKINKLYEEKHTIIYWTARGAVSGDDWTDITEKQLDRWGAKYHELKMNSKPHYDILICDKTKRIEEI
tara:strand:+ start:195 stop:485 length:291 start_codon:yes stop_codon:yes gene_type:complete